MRIMKTILTAFCMLAFTTTAQVQTDKVAHFGVGYMSGAMTSGLITSFGNWKNEWVKSVGFGTLAGVILGTGKELYDQHQGRPFDIKDLGATVVGSLVGSITVKIVVDFSRKKIVEKSFWISEYNTKIRKWV